MYFRNNSGGNVNNPVFARNTGKVVENILWITLRMILKIFRVIHIERFMRVSAFS